MENGNYAKAGQTADRPATRIEGDIEMIKGFINIVEGSTARIIQHARSLGYYEPTPEKGQAPTPVISTLADAIRALSYAIDHNSGALNVFD